VRLKQTSKKPISYGLTTYCKL